MLAGPGANVFPVATETPLYYFRLLAITDGDVNQAYWLLFRAPARTGDSGYAQAKGRRRITANAFGQGPGYFLAHRTVGVD